MKAEISYAANCLLSQPCTQASPLPARTILYGTMPMSFWVMGSSNRRPISRLMAKKVYSGLVTAWRLAAWPTSRDNVGVVHLAHFRAQGRDLDGLLEADEQWAQDAHLSRLLQQLGRNGGGMDGRHDQRVGGLAQPAEGIERKLLAVERDVRGDLAIIFEIYA